MWSAPTPAIHEGAPRFLAVDPRKGRRTAELLAHLRERAADEPMPADWCYVHHFAEPDTPRAIALPTGGARRFQLEVDRSLEAIRSVMRSALDGDALRARRRELGAALRAREERALAALRARAKERDVALVREGDRIVVVPTRGGVVFGTQKLASLHRAERDRRVEEMARVAHELELLLREFRDWARAADRAADELVEQTARRAARGVLQPLRTSYASHPGVAEFLSELEEDLIEHADQLAELDAPGVESDAPAPPRYRVRVVVDHTGDSGAPVVYEPRPTYASLVGRTEPAPDGEAAHWIRPGALHRAIGGYLVLETDEVARHASVRVAIKRTVVSGQIVVESLAHAMGVAKKLGGHHPDPIPFDRSTIVLVGSAVDYDRLAVADAEFSSLFAMVG